MSVLQTYEPLIRFVAFFGVFAVLVWAELRWPRRELSHRRIDRWPSNLGIVAVDNLLARALLPVLPVALALSMEGGGLLGFLGITGWKAVVVTVVALDLIIYLQHVLFHAVPHLWRLHRMHHADTDYDATLALRFHPLEILLSAFIKLGAVAMLGAPATGVILFEVLLNAAAMFNHGNLAIPTPVDRVLRWVLVTPDFHRVHHSDRADEMHRNFGFNLPWWDHLFGTYKAQPALGHEDMTLGLPTFRDPAELRLDRLLTQPFRTDRSSTEGAGEAAVEDVVGQQSQGTTASSDDPADGGPRAAA